MWLLATFLVHVEEWMSRGSRSDINHRQGRVRGHRKEVGEIMGSRGRKTKEKKERREKTDKKMNRSQIQRKCSKKRSTQHSQNKKKNESKRWQLLKK